MSVVQTLGDDRTFDPITTEIIQSSLSAITDEMFATMRKTAMSPIIYEVLDFGVAMTDAHGELASSGAGIPAFVGMLDSGVRAIIRKFEPAGEIAPGDVFLTNMPHFGGVSHLNDVVIILPVFSGGEIIAWLANKAHWVDIGGNFPGSINPQATEIYQEGLQLPEVKVISAGKPVQAVLDIITANSRLPETTLGDFWAGVASMRAGEKRLLGLVEKYGKDAVLHAIDDFMAYGERISKQALKDLPKGEFTAVDHLDDGREIRARVVITDDQFVVDLRGNPPQDPGPFNNSYESSLVDAQMVFKAVTSPQTPANAGTFRPLKLIVDKGSMFAAEYPAAMSLYYETGIRLFDVIWKALAPHMPERLTAGHYASICGTIIGGIHPDTGRAHSFIEPEIGGWGAAFDRDGDNAQYTGSHGDTYNCPVEVNEQRNGVLIDQFTFNPEPGGEGEYIGGKGIVLDYRIRRDGWWITAMYSRSTYSPWGMNGGRDGTRNYVKIIRADGSEEVYSTCTAVPLNEGDVVRVVTATGGGYGDPRNRPPEQVRRDVQNGYISPQQARDVFGLALDDV